EATGIHQTSQQYRSIMVADRARAAAGATGDWLPRMGVRLRAFHEGLKETGFVDGDNVSILYRFAEDQTERLAGLAAELVHRNTLVRTAANLDASRLGRVGVKRVTGQDLEEDRNNIGNKGLRLRLLLPRGGRLQVRRALLQKTAPSA